MRVFKRLKFKTRGGQKGLASIVVTGMLVTLLALIAVSFALVMRRELDRSVSNQTAQAAYYAAESGVNDVSSYLKTHPGANVTSCNTLIGSGGALASAATLSASTKYTCALINSTPSDLAYQSVSAGGSQVVKFTPTATISSLMISWQASNGTNTSYVPSTSLGTLYDETTWSNDKYAPLLRATIYPVPAATKDISYATANARTYYLYPAEHASNDVATINFTADNNGTVQNAGCGATNTGTFSGSADYGCNVIVNNLPTSSGFVYYIELAPYYTNTDVKLKADDPNNKATQFSGTQAVVDVTASSGGTLKRLQARVDLNPSQDIKNIASLSESFPQNALRSAFAICKRLQVPSSGAVYIDGTSQAECGNVPNLPQPTPPTPPTPIMLNAYLTDGGVGGNKILNLAGTVNDHSVAGTKAWFHYVECGSGNDVAQYFYSSPGGQPQSVPVNDNDNPISLSVNPFSFYYCGYNPTSNFQMCAQVPGGDPVCSAPYFITNGGGSGSGSSSSGSGGGSSSGGGGGSCSIGISPSSDNFSVTGNCSGQYSATATYYYCYSPTETRASTYTFPGQSSNFFGDPFGVDPYKVDATAYQGGHSGRASPDPWQTGYPAPCTQPPPTSSSGNPGTSTSTSSTSSSSTSSTGSGSSSSSSSSGGGVGCFTAGTMILTPSGQKPIEQLKPGDWVESWNFSTKKMEPSQITFTYNLKDKPTLWIVTSGGSVTTTSVHPFWTGSAWVQAQDLEPGSYVMDSSGKLQKVLFTMQGANRDVYNFEVMPNHDYFANGFLVHNIITL